MDFSGLRILCVGDLMLDRFVYGDMERISPEAPVPVLRLRRSREMAGGAGNVANNIRSLGGRAVLVGLIGEDAPGRDLQGLLAASVGIEDQSVVSRTRPTTCKTRFIAANQQVIRADEESAQAPDSEEVAALIAACSVEIGQVDAVVVSDYGKGVCAPEIVQAVIDHARVLGKPVFVDPKTLDFARYRHATCITPNARELGLAAGHPTETLEDVERAAYALADQAVVDAILATRSEKGMVLAERGQPIRAVPSRAREVFDVSGAGDTVIATMALAYASGMTLEQSMHVANAAAGVVVGKLGTATADIAEVLAELDAQEDDLAPVGVSSLGQVQGLMARWRAQGLRTGFTNGCFDVLHAGHVSLLAQARASCDRLIVGLNSDASVRRLKGETRPLNGLADRARVIAALRFVDAVVAFEEDTPLETIRALLPDVLVKGADYRRDQVIGGDVVEENGGQVVLAALTPGRSTTALIAKAGGTIRG